MNNVYIVILNWNSWRDTIGCLDSVLKLRYESFKIILCDNASSDNSIEIIKGWLNGSGVPDDTISYDLREAVPFCFYDKDSAERGGVNDADAKVILIQTGDNLGFAGGNNVGIRYALAKDDFDYIWLLNNDTQVEADALYSLVEKAESDETIGIVGSSLCYFSSPELMQARGGATFKPFRCKARPIEEKQPFYPMSQTEERAVDAKLGYVIGASMLVTKPFLQEIGLMAEDYFLYYEELDWAMRARGKYKLALAANSRVYHKVGASAGTSVSLFSLKYLYANQIKFMKRFFPALVWSSRLEILRDACRYLRARQYPQAKLLFRIASGLEYR